MSGDAHVRICESLGVKFPRATRLYLKTDGRMVYLWQAVDAEGEILGRHHDPRRPAEDMTAPATLAAPPITLGPRAPFRHEVPR